MSIGWRGDTERMASMAWSNSGSVVVYEDDHFETPDGLRLYEQCWLPEMDTTAVVVLVHGFIEHSGRYAQMAEQLNDQGYAVYALDLRGHGRSRGEPVFVRSFDEYLDDLEVFVQSVRRREPDRPLFILGHSMGGTIAARFAAQRQPDVQGLILSAPAVMVGKGVFPILRRLASFVGRWFPRLRLVRMGTGRLSRDPEVVAEFCSDPLVFHGRFPVRIGAEILRAAQQVQDEAGAIRLPLLILQGTRDWIVDPKGARRLQTLAGSSDKTVRLYDGLYHDLFHEPEREEVINDLIGWMNDRR